ncbi:Integral membrane protein OS=Streptomyces glaucescens OX=1907 GN=SGLAU_03720 PE=4 SV=1 [Streptomyces glaucescens]
MGALATGQTPSRATRDGHGFVQGAAETAQALGSWLIGLGFILFVTWGRRAYKDASARRTIGILWDVGTFWPRAAHPFAPPCYAERAVPDLTWRIDTWTRSTGGRLVLSGHSQGSVLAAATAWQLSPATRKRVALLTYGSPLERLYGRWFPAHFGPAALSALHREVDCWRNLYRLTDPIGGPVRVPADGGPEVDRAPLKDPLAHGRTDDQPLPAPVLGHSDYQEDPALAEERERLLTRLPELPAQRPQAGP